MPEWRVPLSDVRFTDNEVDAVADVYRGGWLSQGPRVEAFESAFAAHLGSPHAVAVANGTAALHLICAALGLGPSDEVVVPSLTFAATAAAVIHVGATPVFVDIRGTDAPWLSADAAEASIGPRTRAVVAVAYGGHPGELPALRRLCDDRGLALIEDAAHALGSRIAAGSLGTIGDAGAFSFFSNKNMPLGEGGMVVSASADLAARVRLLRSHGMTSGTWGRHTREADSYDVIEPGFNYRLDEARAALGLRLLERIEHDNERRAEIAARYAAALADTPGVRPALSPPPAGDVSAWHVFPVVLDEDRDRGAFRDHLHREGVQTSIHYPPLHLTPAFSPFARERLAVTESYARRTITLPLFPHMSDAQLELVLSAVTSASRRAGQRPARRTV
jgi:dTDP-4-amino-4,6-dideoxygalactose transaminase